MADSGVVYVGEIGKRIKVKVGISLLNLSTAVLHVEKPDGTIAVEWAGTTLGSAADGVVYHDTISGDLSAKGVYRLWAKLTFSDGRLFYGKPTFFEVFNPGEV
jgi:hypothetical protein